MCTNTSLRRIVFVRFRKSCLPVSLAYVLLLRQAFPLQLCCVVRAVLLVFADQKLARPPMRHPQLQNQDPHGTSVACCPWRCRLRAFTNQKNSQAPCRSKCHIISLEYIGMNDWTSMKFCDGCHILHKRKRKKLLQLLHAITLPASNHSLPNPHLYPTPIASTVRLASIQRCRTKVDLWPHLLLSS